MKNILSISDSYEGTHLDVKRSVTTIKSYEMEPYIAVSEYITSDGSSVSGQIKDTLDFCFSECTPDAVFVGYIRDARNAAEAARMIAINKPAIVVSDPSIISDKGEVLMSEDTYNVISTSIFDMSTHIVINHLEAELLAGFSCNDRFDFERAAKKFHACFDACIYIKGCDRTGGKALFLDGSSLTWIDEDKARNNPELSFGNALNCELSLGVTGLKAVTNALYFVNNRRRVSDSIPVPQVMPSLISPAKSLRDIARSIDVEPAQNTPATKPAKTSIIDPITEGTKGTISEIKAPAKTSSNVSGSLSELAEIRKRIEALKKSSM